MRYLPVREDVVEADTRDLNAQKAAIESISPGEVLVIDARSEPGAGTIGDILALRAMRRGAAGIVTDGGLRDSPAVGALDIPTYYRAPHASVLGLLHYPSETNVPVSCGGVLVLPGDVIVGDAEGVVVVPAQLAEEVARDATEQELVEQFAFERVDAGESTRGLFPLADGAACRIRGVARGAFGADGSRARAGGERMRFRSDPARIRGSIAPVVTPFDEAGAVDLDALAKSDRVADRVRLARHLRPRLHG